MKTVRKILKLDPAHRRVLDLILEQPPALVRHHGAGRRCGITYNYVSVKSHWGEEVIWRLVTQARQFYGVRTVERLMKIWREEREATLKRER